MLFFFKQKTAYEMRISDWSSDVCSSDLADGVVEGGDEDVGAERHPRGARGEAGEHGERRRPVVIDDRVVLFHPDGLEAELLRARHLREEIGRASCRERVCQYV